MAKDYYEILGIKKDANEQDIKRAYRKMAMEWHPDKHKGDKTAEDKFKEINKAYETLSDPQKRAGYDQFGESGANFGGGYGGSGFNGSGFDFSGFQGNFDNGQGFADIFEAFFTGFGARSNAPRKGRNLEFELRVDFEEAVFGCEKELVITRPGKSGERSNENIKVKIPAGVDNESVVRLSGKGDPGMNGGPQGDLYVHIRVNAHKDFVRNGFDIHSNAEISVLQAVLGSEIKVKTLEGEITLKVPAGTQPGKVFKLKGYGVKKLHSEEKGDQYVKVNVVIPNKLSKKEKALYQDLAMESGMEPPGKGKGFWK
ncbi:J domain-containing protein [Candidatus Peregrinibacteria bacterium]|nr:J domain-containing protein [Candidatus Peregrinibacteria bacterium]